MPAIYKLEGPVRIDPGKCGNGASFAFVNTSPWPICDLQITTWDDDAFGASPEILPRDGFKISLFDPIELPGGGVGVNNERPMRSGWNRSDAEEETDETKVNFEPGNCIQPGKGFVLNLKFDETLDGNEGIEVAPSRLYDGEHYGIGGDVRQRPAPVTWSDILEVLGKVGSMVPLGALIGQSSKSVSKSLGKLDIATASALVSAIRPDYHDWRLSDIGKLPLHAVNLSAEKTRILQELGINRVADFAVDPDFVRLMFLTRLGRARSL